MSLKTHNFVAEKLVEVVEDKHRRQRMMVNALTVLGLCFLTLFSLFNFNNQNITLASILAFFSVAGLVNIYVMSRWRNIGLIVLTTIIYSLSTILVVSGGYQNTGSLWVYPLAAISIFINHFRQGLILNTFFIGVLTLLIVNDWLIADYNDVMKIRFVITLSALSGMCHILIYFQNKADDYILKMHEEGIHNLAYFDGLTQLANRATFRSILGRTMQRISTQRSALIYIDLDNFKQINDDYGHDAGDSVLVDFGYHLKRIAGDRIGDGLSQYDVARLGGDEFAIFVKQAPRGENNVVALADDVIDLFSNDRLESLRGLKHSMSASIGVVFTSEEQSNLYDSLRLADQAMYEAKKARKGQVRIIDSE
ncbi:GGDEF domain-containing protein [Vibrio sp. YMD68]|uniref:GGDEF domain-containing protein n=1 Tax=Vibrio sp. YMD68 TaxID=3042300 RepID=UPI00249BC903|nr:GGDEF domain-containing protein [Vibrio sp. YMD68]WGW01622.1 GGDEF domain-containing protein [Vibrio sp. YMD68]